MKTRVFFRHSDSNSVRGRRQEEHGLFDCCVIKLFINGIREQAESSFLEKCKQQHQKLREMCRKRKQGSFTPANWDGWSLVRVGKACQVLNCLSPLSLAGGRGRKRREIWLLQDLSIDKEKMVTSGS